MKYEINTERKLRSKAITVQQVVQLWCQFNICHLRLCFCDNSFKQKENMMDVYCYFDRNHI